ncbi:ABC transporter substrate-binding protein [Rugosimonospora acidiphila]|uniref:ABC transporter substrate-binding protein n=1 Tax=Rugosimonospora acidiphila TaxID=556531 RepID=UPI0031ED8E5B
MRRAMAVTTAMAVVAGLAACGGSSSSSGGSVPGVTSTEIIVGTHTPLTGPAAAGYSEISPATKAYFDYVNSKGGVYGRKITFKIEDDAYDPATTQQKVRKLVLQDKVFAILSGLGTPTHTGVLDFLNTNKVPDLFVASGSLSWNQPKKYPYTFGYNPDYTIEGKTFGNYIKANFADKKVCTFGQHDDFGADGLKGVQDVLGASGVTHSETYDVTNTNVAPAIGALKAAGCQVTIAFTVPGFTALALGTAAQLGFKTQWMVSNVGADYATLGSQLKDATGPLLDGMLSTAYLPAPTDTTNPWIALFLKLDQQYDNNAAFDGNVEYGFAVGYLFVQALLAAGKNLTRQGIIAAVEKNGFAGPGLSPLRFSATDHSGFGGLQMAKVEGGKQEVFGPLYTTDDASGPITESSPSQPAPPADGIPS